MNEMCLFSSSVACNSWPLNPSLLSGFIIILLITDMDMGGQAMAMASASHG